MSYPKQYSDLKRASAESLDAADPLHSMKEQFFYPSPTTHDHVYFCGHSLGLLPKQAEPRIHEILEDWKTLAVDAHFEANRPWYPFHEAFAAPLARIVGAKPEEVVAMNGLTTNLHLMMVSFYRPQGKRRKILIEQRAFPSDLYAMQSQIAFHGGDPKTDLLELKAPDGEWEIPLETALQTIEALGDELALVMLGGVNYFTGQAFPVQTITEAAHRVGAKAGWDLAHAAGNLKLELHTWNVDFAVWCGYKYLNGGPGCIGAAFVHEQHGNNFELPRFAGWWGNDPKTRFRMHLEDTFIPQPGADGWQLSNPPIMAMAPLGASLELFDQATMPKLREKSVSLTAYLEFLLRSKLPDSVEIITPNEESSRGCQLSLRLKVEGGSQVVKSLEQHGVTVDFRPPDVIRAAPVPLYNGYVHVWEFVSRLERAIKN